MSDQQHPAATGQETPGQPGAGPAAQAPQAQPTPPQTGGWAPPQPHPQAQAPVHPQLLQPTAATQPHGAPQQHGLGRPAGMAQPPHQNGVPQPPQQPVWARPATAPVFGLPAAGQVPPGGTVPPGYATAAPAAPLPPARRAGRMRIGIAGLVAGALIGGGAGAGVVALFDDHGSPTTPAAAAQNVVIKDPTSATTATAAAAKAAPSVVTIYVTNNSGAGSGSGVVLTDDGYVLTNNHVVTLDSTGTGTVQVRTSDGTLYDASVVGTDASSDLAVVRLKGASNLTPATFADSDKVQVGDVAVAIGAPLGLSNTVTNGIISATDRAVATGSTQNDSTVIDAIQTDAAINPGNSGGALVNAAGEVIGINTAIASVASASPGSSSQSGNIGVGFAIPSDTAKRIAGEIMKNGSATHAVLGVSARTASSDQNSEVGTGAEVVSVQSGSAAADAGLRVGDVITAVGDRAVTDSTELTAAVRSSDPGSTVTLTIRRGNDTQQVDVTLGTTTS